MKKLVAYITAGFPDSNFTVDLAASLKESGVDLLELGIPFSDPVADGPIIEEANLKALKNGFKIESLFEISKQISPYMEILWMGYFNPFYHKGIPYFCSKAQKCGVSGFIVPDLPYEEATFYEPFFNRLNLSLISFVAPTCSDERIAKIVKNSKKFIYLVAYAGITGSGTSENLEDTINSIRRHSDTPIYVGFGVNEKSAKEKAKGVEGVIVGSAFVKILLNENLSFSQKIKDISKMAKNIKEIINDT